MSVNNNIIKRQYFGKDFDEIMPIPNLIEIQMASFEKFLQRERSHQGQKLELVGLEEVFRSSFPIESSNGDLTLEFERYYLDEEAMKFTELECRLKGLTYAVPLKAKINLIFNRTGEIRQKEIYLGDMPLMTDRGTFIINGAERVVVSQIHRSPGVVFHKEKDKPLYKAQIIPYRGSWLEIEVEPKKELLYVRIDRKKRILATMFLRAIGFDSRESIIESFHKSIELPISKDRERNEHIVNMVLSKAIYTESEAGIKKLFRAGVKLHLHDVDELVNRGITSVHVIDFKDEASLHFAMILNCFEREDVKLEKEDPEQDEPSKIDALASVFAAISPGESKTPEAAERDLANLFFTARRYDLGKVGRYKLNKKLRYAEPKETTILEKDDILAIMRYLMNVYYGELPLDDIDHLGNRRIRSVGELLSNILKSAFTRMEKSAKDKMNSTKETETLRPQELISNKPIVVAMKDFFGSSPLSQFMDQVNPLAELTHKRRLSALGPGGVPRENATFEVRDVHYSHYGRMCPIETPEGPNIGLIVSLATYTRVNNYGFLETPFRRVESGKATRELEYLSAIDEDQFYVAQANAKIDKLGDFKETRVSCRHQGDYTTRPSSELHYMDVSPKQIISVSAALIPFLEHDDANRALMGSNMQRQAVPLLFTEAPRVGTGVEQKCAYDSGVLVKAKRSGIVEYVDARSILVKPDADVKARDEYILVKFQRSNQDTCNTQRPIVKAGDKVDKGQVLADGPATRYGELALGKNILAGFVPWNGYNYEDAILISERVIKDDLFTSIHIKEYQVEVRDTKLGMERLTRDIPNMNERILDNLDLDGIIRIGAKVSAGDILVGKVTPKSETETTPEFKLLNSIFGEKARDVRDSSLRVPHGVEGRVIDVQRLKRSESDDLSPGVQEVVTILIAAKRKLKEGDKMAGRHGNKGVVARVLPVEDMPYLEDGTPLDICLNPLGVPSRMNIGQIMETELGWAATQLDEWYSCHVFQSPSQEQIEGKLKEAGLPTNSKVWLRDGRTGEIFKNKVTVGVVYFMKLHHLVDDKMHARSTGPYSLVTQQPLGGKAQFGGQRLGEMEVWALEAYGAANTLQELMTIKSDDMEGRSKIYESLVKGEPQDSVGVPEAFNVMVQELRGLGLEIKVFNIKGEQIPLSERDEDIINKIGVF